MTVTILCVGRMKEKPYRQMADEYRKRLSRFAKIEEIEVADLPEPDGASEAVQEGIRKKEGEGILSRIRPSDSCIP